LRGLSLKLSHVACEIVTWPNGDPPAGGSKIPRTKTRFCSPLAKVSWIGEPTDSVCSFA